MKRPEVVVFDLGKVLVDFDYAIAARRIAQGRRDPLEIQQFIDQSPLLYRYETGLMTRAEFFEAVRRESGFDGTLETFATYFADVFTPIDSMIAVQAALRRAGVPTFIFSNTNDLAVAHIRANFPFFGGFDGYVLSYEHGAMKPDARLYAVVEQVSGRKGDAILYLDDRIENIESGRQRGWQTIHHLSPDATIERVRELELLPQGK